MLMYIFCNFCNLCTKKYAGIYKNKTGVLNYSLQLKVKLIQILIAKNL